MPMLKFKPIALFSVLVGSLYLVGCASVPQNDIPNLENVITEKQKKEALKRDKAAEQAKVIQSGATSKPSISEQKAAYPIITPQPIMRPITAPPAPVAVVKPPVSTTPNQSSAASLSTSETDKNV